MTWKDSKHPQAGGAEVVNDELAKRLVQDGHKVTMLVGGFKGGKTFDNTQGYQVIRLGNRFTVYWHAFRYYKKNLSGWADLVIDEVNTVPFFAKWYVREPCVLFVHQLCRQIWFYQLPPWIGWVGYIAEPIYLRLLNDQKVITVSRSTKRDLMKYGFRPRNISIISEGTEIEPLHSIDEVAKFPRTTMLSLGALRPMKRTLHQVKAFELVKQQIPDLQLKIAGDASDAYGKKVLRYIEDSPYKSDIEYLGRVSDEVRQELMQRCHFITVTSIKEGWGLIVTEAASQGTPAVVYNVDGLRDSVKHEETGIITDANEHALAEGIQNLLADQHHYHQQRKAAWGWSKYITFQQSYEDFKEIVGAS